MPRYQYETSPRKYEPEYTTVKKSTKNIKSQKKSKEDIKKKLEEKKIKRKEERQSKVKQVVFVLIIFGMLLALSYREISIMEMFNQKEELESELALIEKENGQVEKSIKEAESKLDWNKIKQIATEQLGMESKKQITVDLEKTDNVETEKTYIEEDDTTWLEKVIQYFINK